MVTKVDFIGIPSRDAERARTFYLDVLGLRPDGNARFEAWAGDTCFAIWEPEKMGRPFEPVTNAQVALHVDDVGEARRRLEAAGAEILGDQFDTGVCHMAFVKDLDGNAMILHHRYAPQT